MDNLFEPQVAVITPSQVQMIALGLWHATCGVYIWEFFTTLEYEWGVLRGHLPYRWTIWVYSLTRVAALLGVILCLTTMDTTTPINCQLWVVCSVFFFCLSATTSSLLIVLRTIAIWNQNKAVLVLATTIWVTSIALHLQNVARYHSVWIPAHLSCVTVEDPSLLGFIPTIIFDMVLLLIVLAGLIFMRRHDGVTFGLTRLLWKQGVVWLILGSVADVPPLTLTLLHLNDPLHAMFEIPGVIIMTIAATRMHRSLISFASSDVVHGSDGPQASSLAFKTKQTDTSSTVPDSDRAEVVMHKAFGQHQTGSTSGGDSDLTTVFSTKSTCPPPAVSSSHSISQAQSI
ncbi:hypothetical protein V8E52_011420 [Russula decolorans]